MKNLIKLLTLITLCSFTVGFSSCSDDKEETLESTNTLNEADFVGAWRSIDDAEISYLVLNNNNSGRIVVEDLETNEIYEESIAWYYKDNSISMLTSEGLESYYVFKLTESQMILIYQNDIMLSFTRISVSSVPGSSDDDPDDSGSPEGSTTGGITTGSAEPRAFSATISGMYNGNKLPTVVGCQYSYNSSFPANQTGECTINGKFGGLEFEAIHLVDLAKVYYRVFAIVDGERIYGKTKSFETPQGTYSIDGKTYKFIKVTGLATGSFSMMQTELPPNAELEIDGVPIGRWNVNKDSYITKGETREFFTDIFEHAVMPRYPTPEEWQYAASGGSLSKGYKYSGSNNIDEVAWYANNSYGYAITPALKTPNELGFYDMSGNYAEYCAVYSDDVFRIFREEAIKGFASLKEIPASCFNITWSANSAYGGYWGSSVSNCLTTSSVIDKTPSNTNKFNSDIYTARLVYSRPD